MRENISESMRVPAAAVLVTVSGLAGIWWGIRMGLALHTVLGGSSPAGLCAVMCILMTGGLLFQGYSNLKTNRRYGRLYRILLWISGILIPLLIYSLLFMIPMDIVIFLVRAAAGAGPGNRHTLRICDHAALLALVLSALETVYGTARAQRIFVTRYDVPLKKMNSDSDSVLRIAHLSDLHMGSIIGDAYMRRLLRKTAELHPDYVVITGDLFNHGFAEELRRPEKTEAAFRLLQDSLNRDHPASRPVPRIYAVLGNHDPLPDNEPLLRFLRASGITLLDDRAEDLPEFLLAGRNGNHVDGRRNLSEWLPESSAQGRDAGGTSISPSAPGTSDGPDAKPLIVLDHYPDGIHDAQQAGADLMLCGHTHKGQYFPCDWLIRRRYAHGLLYGLSVWGHTVCIVSSGSGFFQIPIRIGTRSEIVCADLRPEIQRS